jgi:hypothetical protein
VLFKTLGYSGAQVLQPENTVLGRVQLDRSGSHDVGLIYVCRSQLGSTFCAGLRGTISPCLVLPVTVFHMKWYHRQSSSVMNSCHGFIVCGSQFSLFQFRLPPDDGVPYKDHQDSRMFHNLRTLHLEKCDLTLRSYGEAPTLLEYVLQNAPNLEKLTLLYCKVRFSIFSVLSN